MLTKPIFRHHFSHVLPMIATMWALYAVAATINVAVKAFAGDRRFSLSGLRDAYFPHELWRGHTARLDMTVWAVTNFFYSIPLRVIGPAVTASLLAASLSHGMPDYQAYHTSLIMLVFCGFLLFLVGDFAHFCGHSINHSLPLLWEFHKVHHSATFLSPFTPDRKHPLCIYFDAMIDTVFLGTAAGVMEFMFNFNLVELFLVTGVVKKLGYLVALDSLKHTHFSVGLGKLEALISSPRMHQIHHSARSEHIGQNLGDVLSIWDRLFGSCYVPAPKECKLLGLGEAEQPEFATLRGIYLGPIVKAGSMVRRRLGSASLRPSAAYNVPPARLF